jgi:hypothetical protein
MPVVYNHPLPTVASAPVGADEFVVFIMGDRKCLAIRPTDYHSALQSTKDGFGIPDHYNLCLKIEYKGQRVEMGELVYNRLRDRVSDIFIDYSVPLVSALANARAITSRPMTEVAKCEDVDARTMPTHSIATISNREEDKGWMPVTVKTITGMY